MAERIEKRRVDVVELQFGSIALHPVGEVDRIVVLGILAGPDDIHGNEIVAAGAADEIGRRLGEQRAIVENVDLDGSARLLGEFRSKGRQDRGKLVVLRSKREGDAAILLVGTDG